jgi:hypothetical protein
LHFSRIKNIFIAFTFLISCGPIFAEAKRNPLCEKQLRNGLQWNKNGDKNWRPNYIRELCDHSVGLAAISCFKKTWNKPGKDWSSAIKLCKGKNYSKPTRKKPELLRKKPINTSNTYTVNFIGAQIGLCKNKDKPWDGISSKGCSDMGRLTQTVAAATALGYAIPGVGQAMAALAVGNSLINKEPDVYGHAKVNGRRVTLISRNSPIRSLDVQPSYPVKLGQIGPGQYIKFYFVDKDLANDDPINSFTISYNDLKPGYDIIRVAEQTAGQVVNVELDVRNR